VYRSLLTLKAMLYVGKRQADEYNQTHSEVDSRQPNSYLNVLDVSNGSEQIEQLQYHESSTINKLASEIVRFYLELEHEDDDDDA
jgi:hypothetical protein